jgi:hypothetical protein
MYKAVRENMFKKNFLFLFSLHNSKLNIGKLTVERGDGKVFQSDGKGAITLYDFKKMKSRCL